MGSHGVPKFCVKVEMISTCVANLVDTCVAATPFAKTETFESGAYGPSPARLALVSFITLFLIFVALLFVGKYLWNNVLVDLVSIAKPVKSVWQLIGLAVLISLLHPGCGCGGRY